MKKWKGNKLCMGDGFCIVFLYQPWQFCLARDSIFVIGAIMSKWCVTNAKSDEI